MTGSANKAVAWSVSSGGGSITAAGIYTAPSTSGTYTITATTQAVPAASVTATVTVTGVSISISPSSISMPVNGTKTFTATVSGTTNKAVTWSAAVGSITNAGAYTAPAGVGSDTVTATSVADPSKSAVSAITVKIGVTISPATLFMNQGDSTSFTAGVDGSDDQTVTWSATGGTMDEWGDYLAPDSAGTQTITARSVADPSVAATAKVTVRSVSLSMSPSALSVETGSSTQIGSSWSNYALNAQVGGTINTNVTWSIVSGGGSVVPPKFGYVASTFLAPFTPGTTVLKATSVADPTKSATATITVTQGTKPMIRSFTAIPSRLSPGGTSQLSGDFGNGTGVLTPGGVAILAGTPVPVSPSASTHYTLTVASSDSSTATQSLNVAVVGPGSVSALPNYPSPIITSDMGAAGTALQLVVARDGTVVGIGGRPTYQDPDLHLYRLDIANNQWVPLSTLPGRGEIVRFNALALPDGNIFIITALNVTYQNSTTYGEFISLIYVVNPTTGAIVRSADLSSSYNFAYNETTSLLPDGRILVAGGMMLPSGVNSCAYGLSCNEPKNWISFIDPTSLVITNSTVTLNHARFNHTALTLQDGRILFVGGGTPVLEIYDPVAKTSTDVGTLNASSACATLLPDGRVLCLGAGLGQNAVFDPTTSSLAYAPDTSGDAGFNPLLLSNGLVLANLGNADASLWDPIQGVRLGTLNASDSVYFDRISLYPTLLPDGTVIGGSYAHVTRFDPQPALKINPAFAQENAGRVVPFAVTNPNGATIAWSASGGTVDASGNFIAPSIGTYHVVATASDGRKAIATVNVLPAVGVRIDPVPTIQQANGSWYLLPGNVVQLTARVVNSPNPNLSWSLASGTVGAAITSTGQFTATQPGIYQAIATPEADGTRSSSIAVWVWPANVQVPVITSFTANPTDVGPAGGQVTLTCQATGWEQENGGIGYAAYIPGIPGVWRSSGNQITVPVKPIPSNAQNGWVLVTTYHLVAGNVGGTTEVQIPVTTHAEMLSISPEMPTVLPGMSLQFGYAFAWAPGNTGVTWQASGGTIDANGIFTAPSQAGTYTIQARSSDSPNIVTSTAVSVVVPTLTVAPSTLSLNAGQPRAFTCGIVPSGPVTWTCSGGSVDGSGLFTAPETPGTYTVTASSALYPAASSSATVTVLPPAQVTLSVLPTQLSVLSGGSASLASTIQVTGSSDTGITWTDSAGNILGKGGAAFYTAPLLPGSYAITATSDANPSESVSIPVLVSAPPVAPARLAALPAQATLLVGQRVFIGSDLALPNPGQNLLWTATGGVLQPDAATASAFFTAPSAPGTYTVTAGDTQGLSLSSSATLTVVSGTPSAFNVMPSTATLSTGQSMLLEAADGQGNVIPSAQWTVQEQAGGIISSAGQYFAPTTAGTYHVVATNPLNNTQTAIATVTVMALGGGGGGGALPSDDGVTVSPGTASISAGSYQGLSAIVAGADDQSVNWTVENAPATASVDETGVFVANQTGTYRVFATSTANPGLSGSAVIQVVSSVQTVPGAPSSQAVYGMSVTALNDGRILIAGGQDATGLATASARMYDPTSKAFSALPPMTIPRAYHTALLLQDGRVLLAGGQMGQVQAFNLAIGGTGVDVYGRIRSAEVFDPSTNQFIALPVQSVQWPGPSSVKGLMRGRHIAGTSILLPTGQALVIGGQDIYIEADTGHIRPSTYAQFSDVFDPVSNLFDVSNATSDDPYWSQTPNCFFTHEGVAAVTLDDGSVLATGGEISPMVWDQPDGIMPSPKLDTYYGAVLSEAWTYTLAGGKAQMPTMTVPRAGHTMTKLADGRVLIVGGRTLVNYLTNPPKPNPDPQDHYLSTATAEIYDPVNRSFTPTGSLNEARDRHAAILLPSGQVLIVGGVHENGDGTYSYPHTTELYDPDTGTFSVMDHLDYGLEEPKLALLPDGSVFAAGRVQAPMEGPAQAALKANKLGVANLPGFSWLTGSSLFGTIATPASNIFAAYPLNEVTAAQLNKATPPVPLYSFISIPLPFGFGLADAGSPPLPTFLNSSQRSFILAVLKPTREFKITDINVDLVVGASRQRVLTRQPRTDLIPTTTGVFHQIDAMTLPENIGSTSVNWAANWINTVKQRANAHESTRGRVEFYSIQVTFSPDQIDMSSIPYGLDTNQGVTLPPGGQISYDLQIFGAIGTNAAIKVSSRPFSSSLTVQTNGLWSVAQWFQNSYMPTWDNDKWCDYRTFQWVTSNRQLVGPVNDISLEHGKKGDHINHLDGTMLDMFHPGYRSYVDADMPGSGSDFRDSRIFSDLGAARNGNPAARARLINWIAAARTNLTAIFNQLPTGSGYRLDAAIYMVTNVLPSYRTIYASPSDDPTWTSALKKSDPTNATQLQRKQLVNDGHQIYQLLLKGYCDSYQIYDDQSEPALVADGAGLNLGIGETDSRDFQPRFYAWTNHIHTNHLHLFLKK